MIGIFAIFGATYETATGSIDYSFVMKQILFLAVGLFLYFIFSSVKYDHLAAISPVFLLTIFALLILVEFIGTTVYGSKRWIIVGPFSLQPSEFLKPFLAVFYSYLYSFKAERYTKNKVFHPSILFIVITLISCFLIFIQPDLGTSLAILVSSVFCISISFYSRIRAMLLLFVGVITSIIGWFFVPYDYPKERVLDFLSGILENKFHYNVEQALKAIKSGGLFGIGLGYGQESVLRYLPSRHTDFIFAVIFELFGLIGGFFTMFLMFVLLNSLWTLASNTKTKHTYLASSFIAMVFSIQTIVNIGMNLGLLPVTGIPLPFLSSGGSALIAQFISLGIITSASKVDIFQTHDTLRIHKTIESVPTIIE